MRRAGSPRRDDLAGSEVVGAILVLGILVGAIAYLNVSAVPAAARAAEAEHERRVLEGLNALQSAAEAAGGAVGQGAAVGIPLAPERATGDVLGVLLAKPPQATGQISFERDYGGISLRHETPAGPVYTLGAEGRTLPAGRVAFSPSPVFGAAPSLQLEHGALIEVRDGVASMRYAPPVTLAVEGGVTHLAVKARLLNGTDASLGGSTGVRLGLHTEVATQTSAPAPNAERVVLRVESAHPAAWEAFFQRLADGSGLAACGGSALARLSAPGGLEAVEWSVSGCGGAGATDVRLTTGLAVYGVTLG